jgi:hypothetical protein
MDIHDLIKRAGNNEKFRKRLLSNPKAIFEKFGIEVEESTFKKDPLKPEINNKSLMQGGYRP